MSGRPPGPRPSGRRSPDRPLAPAEFAEAFAGLAALRAPALLAVSGGPDSTALLHAAARWRDEAGGPALVVATVDHGLRPEASAEAEAVAEAAARLGLPHRLLRWTDPPPRQVSQEAAREARYRLLGEAARAAGAGAVVTAHTLDDQAETILMRLAAGSGLAGLAGMAARSRLGGLDLLRPFLGLAKAALVATCREEGWAFVDDPSNADRRHARPRWRALAPTLAAEGLDATRIARFAERARRAEAALAAAARRALRTSAVGLPLSRDEEHGGVPPTLVGAATLDFSRLAREPEEIVIRAVALALNPAAPLRLERLETCVASLLAALAGTRPCRRTLAGRLLSLDRAGRLVISAEPPRHRGLRSPVTLPRGEAAPSLGRGEVHA